MSQPWQPGHCQNGAGLQTRRPRSYGAAVVLAAVSWRFAVFDLWLVQRLISGQAFANQAWAADSDSWVVMWASAVGDTVARQVAWCSRIQMSIDGTWAYWGIELFQGFFAGAQKLALPWRSPWQSGRTVGLQSHQLVPCLQDFG